MILNNASYVKLNGDEIALMKLDGVIVFKNLRLRCVEYTVNNNRVNPLNYSDGNGLPLLYKSADDYSTDYYELIEITLEDGTITTDVTTRCDLISKVKVWWPSSVIGISFAHGTTKLVKSIDYVHISSSFEEYYPFVERGTSTTSYGDSTITSLNVSNWEVNEVLNSLFKNLSSLTTLTGIEKWNTSEVTEMMSTFYGCEALTSLDLSNWDMSKVKYMNFLFYGCNSLTTLNLSNWHTNSLLVMSNLFDDCYALKTITGLESWDISKVSNLSSIFQSCNSLTTLNVSTWDTRKVKKMTNMFNNCKALTSLDLSGWYTDSLEDTAYMFDGCEALEYLDIRNFDFSNITNRLDMFRNCYALKEIRLDNCNSDTISKIIGANAGLPREAFADGTKGKLYVKSANVTNLEPPDHWKFVYVN